MTSENIASTLQVLAATENCPVVALWIEEEIVWRATNDGSLRTVCAMNTPFWEASKITAQLLAKINR